MLRTLTILLLIFFSTQQVQGQLFKRWRKGSARTSYQRPTYQKIEGGWVYNGREYLLGRDGPVSENCFCPMCVALRKARKMSKGISTGQETIPSPDYQIQDVLLLAALDEDSVFLDLGSGLGDVMKAVYKQYKCRVMGVEISPTSFLQSARNLRDIPETHQKLFLNDILKEEAYQQIAKDGWRPTFVFLYHDEEMLKKLVPLLSRLPSKTQILSARHPIPGIQTTEYQLADRRYYLWVR